MIQVGEKLLLDGKQIKVIIYNDCGGVYVSDNADDEKGIELTYEEAYEYLWLYEKHRADEAEKRADEAVKRTDAADEKWEDLKRQAVETYNGLDDFRHMAYKQMVRSLICVMDELEGKENVFETVQKLERGGVDD